MTGFSDKIFASDYKQTMMMAEKKGSTSMFVSFYRFAKFMGPCECGVIWWECNRASLMCYYNIIINITKFNLFLLHIKCWWKKSSLCYLIRVNLNRVFFYYYHKVEEGYSSPLLMLLLFILDLRWNERRWIFIWN